MKPRFIISGGGTGGHIFPAIAIANALKARFCDAEFLFVGAQDRMEMQRVPQAGFPIEGLWISGLKREVSLDNLAFPIKLLSSLRRSRKIIKDFKPDVAIGTGGYASAPLLKVAAGQNIPCLIQEQNSYAGITNKWLAKDVKKICVAYEGMETFFPTEKLVHTGNPVREELIETAVSKNEALLHFNLSSRRKTLLVLGGSLGAAAINKLIASHLKMFQDLDLQVVWQCGSYYKKEYTAFDGENVRVVEFVDRMDLAYAAADFIISRAGALSVSELCLIGKPVIFIPSPNVAEDHQTKNAQAIAAKNAAILVKEIDLDKTFKSTFIELLNSQERQQTLSRNIKKLAKPNATEAIVNEIEKLLKPSISK